MTESNGQRRGNVLAAIILGGSIMVAAYLHAHSTRYNVIGARPHLRTDSWTGTVWYLNRIEGSPYVYYHWKRVSEEENELLALLKSPAP